MAETDDGTGDDAEDDAAEDAFLREVARIDEDQSGGPSLERVAGSMLGRFVLRGELGRGGMGIVYRAHDPTLGRNVALKVLPSEREGDPQRRARFLREARSAAAIVHPNVATVYEIGEADASLFIAMELVGGESLRARFSGGRPLPAAEVIEIAKGIARGLAAAHAQGIVHRDLKPENVMVDPEKGVLKILDFGLAKLHDAREAPREVLEQQPTDAVSTAEGQLLGTPAYMSPEQAAGRALDGRSDLFSLGIVLYEALTGGRPFAGDTSFETLAAVLRDTPVPLRKANPEVPADVAALVMRCLAKAPAERPESADALLRALEALDPRVKGTRVQSRAVKGAALLALVLVAALVVKTQLGAAPTASFAVPSASVVLPSATVAAPSATVAAPSAAVTAPSATVTAPSAAASSSVVAVRSAPPTPPSAKAPGRIARPLTPAVSASASATTPQAHDDPLSGQL